MKKVLVVLLLIVMTLSFTACAEITLSTVIDEGGGRTKGYTVVLHKDYVHMTSDEYVKICERLSTVFQNFRDMEESRGGETTLVIDPDNGKFDLQVYYPTVTDYYASLGLSGYEENEPMGVHSESAFFVNYYSESPVISEETVNTYKGYFADMIKDEINLFDGIDMKYVYGTAYDSVYSTNATETYSEDGYNYMVWDLDLNNPDSTVPILISRTPKVWVFEVLGISAGVLAIGIVMTVVFIKKKKKKSVTAEK